MTLRQYQKAVAKLDYAPKELWYACLGLAGEVGEVIEPIKKAYRDNRRINKRHMALELGDVLWYLTCLIHRQGYQLEDIANWNIQKLQKRQVKKASTRKT